MSKGITIEKWHAQAHITMRQAIARYHLRYDRTGWEPGMLRMGKYGFYHLPRWADNVESLGIHLQLRARRRCIQCRMPDGVHKLDCTGSWRIRDDLLQLVPQYHAWLVRRAERRQS